MSWGSGGFLRRSPENLKVGGEVLGKKRKMRQHKRHLCIVSRIWNWGLWKPDNAFINQLKMGQKPLIQLDKMFLSRVNHFWVRL